MTIISHLEATLLLCVQHSCWPRYMNLKANLYRVSSLTTLAITLFFTYISTFRNGKSLSVPCSIPFASVIMHLLTLSTSFAVLAGVGQAIRTVPSSPCAAKCGDITNTTSSEIVCKDADYGTATGQVFAECITCQLGSNATDSSSGDSDLKWLLCMRTTYTVETSC